MFTLERISVPARSALLCVCVFETIENESMRTGPPMSEIDVMDVLSKHAHIPPPMSEIDFPSLMAVLGNPKPSSDAEKGAKIKINSRFDPAADQNPFFVPPPAAERTQRFLSSTHPPAADVNQLFRDGRRPLYNG